MAKRWIYRGDINLSEGGFYWREDDADDYVLAVEVTPCSACGGPDNLYWITSGTIYLGDTAKQNESLSVIGVLPSEATRADYVEAALAYRGIESDCHNGRQILQHGAKLEPADFWRWNDSAVEPDIILRRNASLRKYVEREFLR